MHAEKGLWFASFWCHLAPLRWTSVRLSSLTIAQGSWLTIGGAAKWPSQLPGRMSPWSVLPCSLLKVGLEWFCGNHEPIDRKDRLGAALFPGPLPILGFQVVEPKAGDSSVWPHEEAPSCPVPAQPSSCCAHHQAHTCAGSLGTWMVCSQDWGWDMGGKVPGPLAPLDPLPWKPSANAMKIETMKTSSAVRFPVLLSQEENTRKDPRWHFPSSGRKKPQHWAKATTKANTSINTRTIHSPFSKEYWDAFCRRAYVF